MDDQFDGMDLLDLNGDGYIDAVDTDGDGVANAFDDDGDGFFEGLDTNDDGVADRFDLNADREIDAMDTNGDGAADATDLNGDGMLEFDTDGDGYFESLDTDGDGAPDMADLDGDGVVETPLDSTTPSDQDTPPYDGEYDDENDGTSVYDPDESGAPGSYDIDGDGIPDAYDPDGDGIPNVYDFNGDGVTDAELSFADLDGDGAPDILYVSQDQDYDGVADYSVIIQDTDGNGAIESDEIYDADDWAAMFDRQTGAGSTYDPQDYAGSAVGYDHFDPAQSDPSQVIGNPGDDMQDWGFQGPTQECAIYSQCTAYENLTGQDVDIEQMVQVATEEGWFDPENGTSFDDMDEILNYLGAETTEGDGGTFESLKQCLKNDGRMVVAVDCDELWHGDNDNDYIPNSPNHAVEVIGIDYSGEEPMVIINDSGPSDGAGAMIPASQFMDAWEDSDYAYVEAYA